MRRFIVRSGFPIAAVLLAVAAVAVSTPAQAGWIRGGFGWGYHGRPWVGPRVVFGGPIVVGPPVLVAPPVVYVRPALPPRRVWIGAYWNGPYWVRGHWGY